MTEEQVLELHRKFRRHRRPEDGDRLLKHHHGFAVQIARRHVGPHLSFDDAVSTAIRGLYEALKRYDPKEGAFTTFAYWWIFKLIANERTFYKHVVRIPSKVIRQSRRVQRLISEGRSDQEIADDMKIDLEDVKRLAELHLHPTGQQIIQEDGIEDPNDEVSTGIDITEHESMVQRLEEAMDRLDKRSRHIVRSRHSSYPLSFPKLAKIHKISRQQVRNIYEAAIKKLRWHCRKP